MINVIQAIKHLCGAQRHSIEATKILLSEIKVLKKRVAALEKKRKR